MADNHNFNPRQRQEEEDRYPRISHAENAFDPDFDIRGTPQSNRRRESLLEQQHQHLRRKRDYPGFDSPWTPAYEDTYEQNYEAQIQQRRPNQTFEAGSDSPFPGSSWSYAENEWYMRPADGRNFYGKGPKGWKRADERIHEDVCEALYQSWEVDASNIEVVVKDGHVYLQGTVSSRNTKRRAEETVEFISGVADVINELRVMEAGRP
jgi:osmotically-inducible protein OsmY